MTKKKHIMPEKPYNKEILNIKYIILLKGKKEIEIKDWDDTTNKIGDHFHHNLHIGTFPVRDMQIGDNCYHNTFVDDVAINLDDFWDRVLFCLKIIFKYKHL